MLEVADQGLLKRVLAIESGNFKSATTSALAAFRAACKKRDELEEKWQAIGKRNSRTASIPLLLVQLPNRDAEGEFEATEKELMSEAVAQYGAGAAHVIQDEKGLAPRFVDAGTARLDPTLKVVFYQSALDEGWDCPRAQLLLSLRTQLEKDRITQIIGRILRMPDATHTGDLDCDTAYLWAPLFDAGSAASVKAKLEEGFKRPDGSPGQFVQQRTIY
jgi:type III restriction enzyme